MRFRWNARADSASTMIFWVGSLIAALICVIWLSKNLYPDHITLQEIDNELNGLQRSLNTACRMDTYWKNYYPKVNDGSLIVKDLQVCIDSSPCRVIFYRSNTTEPVFSDDRIILNNSLACTDVKSCHAFYYNSDDEPAIYPDRIELSNATTCESKHEPIVRCRLITCMLNISENLGLHDLTFINITKDENGTYSFQAH